MNRLVNGPDSFDDWLERHRDWKTRAIVLVVIIFAGIGMVVTMNYIWPCKISERCYPTDEPSHVGY